MATSVEIYVASWPRLAELRSEGGCGRGGGGSAGQGGIAVIAAAPAVAA